MRERRTPIRPRPGYGAEQKPSEETDKVAITKKKAAKKAPAKKAAAKEKNDD